MSNPVFRFATVQGQNIHWFLRRNCSVTPKQMGLFFLSVCVVSIGIAAWFWSLGAHLVLPFAFAEMLVLATALFVFARHATDGERITLQGAQLVVELESAGRLSRAEFNRDRVRVEPGAGEHSLIELSGQGRRVAVGRYVRPELRPALAREIRMALHGA